MMEFFLILFLIIVNGLFSMAEIALVSARKARLEAQAAKGDEDAAKALKLANHPDTFGRPSCHLQCVRNTILYSARATSASKRGPSHRF